MPEETDGSLETTEIEQEAASGKPSILAKAYIALILVALVIGECLAAYFIVPDPTETAAMMGVPAPETEEAEDETTDPFDQVESALGDQMEVDLGDFHMTAYQPLSNSTLRLDFHLYGTIIKDDLEAFDLAYLENENRLRDQALGIFRSAEVTDLTDAKLGLIKRKILATSNQLLGEPYLRTIVFSDFSFIEQ
jgi:hypothetical protein